MKAKPYKYEVREEGRYFVPCPAEEATHLELMMPGPVGRLRLKVITKGTREGTGAWSWNGDCEKPTLRPSVLTTSGHFVPGHDRHLHCWCKMEIEVYKCYRCHSWINDGMVQFLSDSTHELASQIVPLLDVD